MDREPVPAADAAGQPAAGATVAVETVLRLLTPESGGVPVRCGLSYDPADPYAVRLVFHPDTPDGDPVDWSFARELLATGLHEPTGIGDVRIWPWNTPGGDAVALVLTSPDGQALLQAPRAPLARFLRDTYAVVPAGREDEHLADLATVNVWLAALGRGEDQGASGR